MNSRLITMKRRRQLRGASGRYWRKKAAEFRALGLTTRGTVRVKNQVQVSSRLRGRARKTVVQRLRRHRQLLEGITSRGQCFLTAADQAWRRQRGDMGLIEVAEPTSNWRAFWRDAA